MNKFLQTIIISSLFYISTFGQSIPDSLNGYQLDTIVTFNSDSSQIDTLIICKRKNIVIDYDTVTIKIKKKRSKQSFVYSNNFDFGVGIESNIFNNILYNKINVSTSIKYSPAILNFINFSQKLQKRRFYVEFDFKLINEQYLISHYFPDSTINITNRYEYDTIQYITIGNDSKNFVYAIIRERIERDTSYEYLTQDESNMNRRIKLDFPILFGLNFNRKHLTASVYSGVSLQLNLLRGKRFNDTFMIFSDISKSYYNPINALLMAGIKCNYKFNKVLNLFIDCRYKYYLTEYLKIKEDVDRSVFNLSGGCTINLKKSGTKKK